MSATYPEQYVCRWCGLPCKPGEPVYQPDQHQICADLMEADNVAVLENYQRNHPGCTFEESFHASFPGCPLPEDWQKLPP